ncbi:MAG: metalloregulator ArsR/SmtB family transcription factor [Spirochaetaceae bacterium]|nr:metalloregulator ArsR/SmtB family transcription factor [Spirochaetaceae bacterium]
MANEGPATLAVEDAASTFAALGSEQRLTVLHVLVRAGPEGLPIGSLGERSGVTGSTLTHHVRILTQAGLVNRVKRGRSVICAAVAYPRVQALSDYLLSECCTDSAQPHPGAHHE